MSKRKRETADEESATSELSKRIKKQKNTPRAPHAKAPSDAIPKHTKTQDFAQVPPDRSNDKLARKLAKQEKKALKKLQRDDLGPDDGTKTGEDHGDTGKLQGQVGESLEKGQMVGSGNRQKSREREREDGQKLTRKHKSKKDKRKDSTGRSSRKKDEETAVEAATWKVSDSVGGQMLDVDPVFSPDEKYVTTLQEAYSLAF